MMRVDDSSRAELHHHQSTIEADLEAGASRGTEVLCRVDSVPAVGELCSVVRRRLSTASQGAAFGLLEPARGCETVTVSTSADIAILAN